MCNSKTKDEKPPQEASYGRKKLIVHSIIIVYGILGWLDWSLLPSQRLVTSCRCITLCLHSTLLRRVKRAILNKLWAYAYSLYVFSSGKQAKICRTFTTQTSFCSDMIWYSRSTSKQNNCRWINTIRGHSMNIVFGFGGSIATLATQIKFMKSM